MEQADARVHMDRPITSFGDAAAMAMSSQQTNSPGGGGGGGSSIQHIPSTASTRAAHSSMVVHRIRIHVISAQNLKLDPRVLAGLGAGAGGARAGTGGDSPFGNIAGAMTAHAKLRIKVDISLVRLIPSPAPEMDQLYGRSNPVSSMVMNEVQLPGSLDGISRGDEMLFATEPVPMQEGGGAAPPAPGTTSTTSVAWDAHFARDFVFDFSSAAHGEKYPPGWTGREELKFVISAVDNFGRSIYIGELYVPLCVCVATHESAGAVLQGRRGNRVVEGPNIPNIGMVYKPHQGESYSLPGPQIDGWFPIQRVCGAESVAAGDYRPTVPPWRSDADAGTGSGDAGLLRVRMEHLVTSSPLDYSGTGKHGVLSPTEARKLASRCRVESDKTMSTGTAGEAMTFSISVGGVGDHISFRGVADRIMHPFRKHHREDSSKLQSSRHMLQHMHAYARLISPDPENIVPPNESSSMARRLAEITAAEAPSPNAKGGSQPDVSQVSAAMDAVAAIRNARRLLAREGGGGGGPPQSPGGTPRPPGGGSPSRSSQDGSVIGGRSDELDATPDPYQKKRLFFHVQTSNDADGEDEVIIEGQQVFTTSGRYELVVQVYDSAVDDGDADEWGGDNNKGRKGEGPWNIRGSPFVFSVRSSTTDARCTRVVFPSVPAPLPGSPPRNNAITSPSSALGNDPSTEQSVTAVQGGEPLEVRIVTYDEYGNRVRESGEQFIVTVQELTEAGGEKEKGAAVFYNDGGEEDETPEERKHRLEEERLVQTILAQLMGQDEVRLDEEGNVVFTERQVCSWTLI